MRLHLPAVMWPTPPQAAGVWQEKTDVKLEDFRLFSSVDEIRRIWNDSSTEVS